MHIVHKFLYLSMCVAAISFVANSQPVYGQKKLVSKQSKGKAGDKLEALKTHGPLPADSLQLRRELSRRMEQKKAIEWVTSLQIDDTAKQARIIDVVATHLNAVDDWVSTHSYTSVPAGINPLSGRSLNEVDRRVIANSAMPASVHQNLMAGLRKDLNEAQVDLILDKYTIGKVAFTMKAYREIVPNITPTEDSTILSFLKQAREQAVDYSGMKQVSAIFEIYKTKAEQYLNSNGRNWRTMYSNYTAMLKAKKAAETPSKSPAQ